MLVKFHTGGTYQPGVGGATFGWRAKVRRPKRPKPWGEVDHGAGQEAKSREDPRFRRVTPGEVPLAKAHRRRHQAKAYNRGRDKRFGRLRPGSKAWHEVRWRRTRKLREAHLSWPAVTHYTDPCCEITLVPMEYSVNVAVRGHYGEFTPAGSWTTGYKYPRNCLWWDIEYRVVTPVH